jgi:DHA1 family multidrug resistance protein-like MFS transporter
VGIILAIAGVSAALSSWNVQRLSDRFGYRRVLIVATAMAGILYMPAYFAQAVWQLIVVRTMVGICLGAAMPTATAIVGLVTPEHRRASAYGLIASASSVGVAIGPLVGGSLGAYLGLPVVFLATGIVYVLVAVAVATVVREPGQGTATEAEAQPTPTPVIRRVIAGNARGRK